MELRLKLWKSFITFQWEYCQERHWLKHIVLKLSKTKAFTLVLCHKDTGADRCSARKSSKFRKAFFPICIKNNKNTWLQTTCYQAVVLPGTDQKTPENNMGLRFFNKNLTKTAKIFRGILGLNLFIHNIFAANHDFQPISIRQRIATLAAFTTIEAGVQPTHIHTAEDAILLMGWLQVSPSVPTRVGPFFPTRQRIWTRIPGIKKRLEGFFSPICTTGEQQDLWNTPCVVLLRSRSSWNTPLFCHSPCVDHAHGRELRARFSPPGYTSGP